MTRSSCTASHEFPHQIIDPVAGLQEDASQHLHFGPGVRGLQFAFQNIDEPVLSSQLELKRTGSIFYS
jgi:hypothetical protein